MSVETAAVRQPNVAPAQSVAASSVVRLRFRERSRVVVRGPVSGRNYAFSGAQPVQDVARADAEALLRTGFFSRA